MARKKNEEDLTPNRQVELVTMYGTEASPYHEVGEETQVHPDMVEHFKSRGLSETKPDVKGSEEETE